MRVVLFLMVTKPLQHYGLYDICLRVVLFLMVTKPGFCDFYCALV